MNRHTHSALLEKAKGLATDLAPLGEQVTRLINAEREISAGPQEFAALAPAAREINAGLIRAEAGISQLQSQLQQAATSPAASATYRRVLSASPDTDGYTDVSAAMPEAETQDATDQQQVWSSLGELWSKQLIRVKIQVIKND